MGPDRTARREKRRPAVSKRRRLHPWPIARFTPIDPNRAAPVRTGAAPLRCNIGQSRAQPTSGWLLPAVLPVPPAPLPHRGFHHSINDFGCRPMPRWCQITAFFGPAGEREVAFRAARRRRGCDSGSECDRSTRRRNRRVIHWWFVWLTVGTGAAARRLGKMTFREGSFQGRGFPTAVN
jgi:hypothetical protein